MHAKTKEKATQRKVVELLCDLGKVRENLAGATEIAGGAAHWGGTTHWEKISIVYLNRHGTLARRGALGKWRGAYT